MITYSGIMHTCGTCEGGGAIKIQVADRLKAKQIVLKDVNL